MKFFKLVGFRLSKLISNGIELFPIITVDFEYRVIQILWMNEDFFLFARSIDFSIGSFNESLLS